MVLDKLEYMYIVWVRFLYTCL